MRLDGGLGFEPVEDVGGFEGAFISQPIAFGVALRGSNGLRALVQAMDMRRAGTSAVKRESAKKTETIQHLTSARQRGDQRVVLLLVQIKSGLVARQDVRLELQAVQVHGHGAVKRAGEQPGAFGHALKFAERSLVSLHNRAR